MALMGLGGTPDGDPGGELAIPLYLFRLSSARADGALGDAGAPAGTRDWR
jgi:hypothetical protein